MSFTTLSGRGSLWCPYPDKAGKPRNPFGRVIAVTESDPTAHGGRVTPVSFTQTGSQHKTLPLSGFNHQGTRHPCPAPPARQITQHPRLIVRLGFEFEQGVTAACAPWRIGSVQHQPLAPRMHQDLQLALQLRSTVHAKLLDPCQPRLIQLLNQRLQRTPTHLKSL